LVATSGLVFPPTTNRLIFLSAWTRTRCDRFKGVCIPTVIIVASSDSVTKSTPLIWVLLWGIGLALIDEQSFVACECAAAKPAPGTVKVAAKHKVTHARSSTESQVL